RPAVAADFPVVSALYLQIQQLHIDLRPDLYRPVDTIITPEVFSDAVREENLWLAVIGDSPVGFMQIEVRQIESPARYPKSVLYIHAIGVDENSRRTGAGRSLMEKAQQLAADRKCSGVELQVIAVNEAALAFYTKLGFTPRSVNMEKI
ncbi:MAG: GNAT family N-acetyltransferase, partial [Treponemataceae bacterium]|nr:GNAT family N-acetyltransferase [Treponemataceae bacterium]